jgi:diacylglycerol kinase (ATP)
MNSKPHNTGLKRLKFACINSYVGLITCFKNETAFRQEVILSLILLPLAVCIADTGVELSLLIASVCLILITELLNSGLESLADAISTEHHPLLGRAKDYGSAAVMLAIICALLTWLAVIFA